MGTGRVTKGMRYQAFCLVCCGGGKFLGRPAGKRQADREATSHGNVYGHHVTIIESPSALTELAMLLGSSRKED